LEKTEWQERISNDEILTIVDEIRCLIRTIGERKKNWIGHVLMGNGLLRDVLEERMLGSRPQGRPRMGMIEELREVQMKGNRKEKESFGSLKGRTEDREGWSFCAEDRTEGQKLMMMIVDQY
jgi:hypothetical protein